MFIRLILAIGTKCSLAKGLGTQYRDVSENEVFHFMVLSVRGSRAVKPRRVCCSDSFCISSKCTHLNHRPVLHSFAPSARNDRRRTLLTAELIMTESYSRDG